MLNAIKRLVARLRPKSQKDIDEEYLAEAVSIVDLEIRMRHLEQRVNNTSHWLR